ncbi:MAG: tetratricopeptide repeat-containing protein [Phenylobacterium sp.]
MSSSSLLLSIIAHARAGALDHAWRLFREAGLEAVDDDPAVLSVRGRLLKDRALAAEGAARRKLYGEAAAAYAKAGALSGASYPLINAATLALLAGDAAGAQAGAGKVLAALDADPDEAETPYWRGATRAEALLVLGQVDEARAALAEAVALAPRAWEDHASTLRQFALILASLDQDAGWLDALRPPRTLHFAGHMSLGQRAHDMALEAGRLLGLERVGFGYGALAAGADIVVAEALAAQGAELNVVLPSEPAAFRAASVAPAGGDRGARFDALLAAAESVRVVGSGADDPLAIELAAEVAMGCAAMRAQALATEALQVVVVDDASGASGWSRSKWADSGRRQHVLVTPREGAEPTGRPGSGTARLAALLLADLGAGPEGRFVEEILPGLSAVAGRGPSPTAPARWDGRRLSLVFAAPAQAAEAALAIAAVAREAKIAAHYGLVRMAPDPFGGDDLVLGEAAALAAAILAGAPAGAIHVSDDFAAALHAGPPGGWRTEYVGDLASDDVARATGLYALKA